jgi:TonB family protein
VRRRRQKNPLLGKMIGVAVLINAILLPILASLGVFHAGRQHLQMVQLVSLPKLPPKPPVPKNKVAKKPPHAHPHQDTHVAKSGADHPSRPNPNAPKVVASASTGGSGGNDVDNSGTGKAGVVPQQPTAPPTPVQPAPTPVTPTPAPTPTPVVTPPAPPAPVHVPVVEAASVVKEINPVIPDDFGVDQAPPPVEAVFTIKPDGTASISDIQSSGNPQLDGLVLDAVKRWTFKPATKDGVPMESYLRLKVEFDLS